MATISCAARPKKNASGRLTEAAWVAENEASSENVARFVQDIYLARYGAHIAPPRGPFLALRDATGQVRAALALRRGETPFFLEHYLDAPVQTLLPGGVREGIVEVGSLAADVPGGARALVVTLTAFLAACSMQWVVFTARRELRNTFARLGIVLHPLTLTRLEPDVTRTLRGELDLREIAREAVAELAPLALERGVELGLDAPEPAPVHGIALALGILVRNLIDNAIRHSPAGGRVDVRLSTDTATVTLTASDQGPGIPPEERARVFEPFYRVPGSPSGGAGLGLAIVQRIVAFHGGRVGAEEGPDGRGTTMRVVLPRPDAASSESLSALTETP